MLATVWLLPVAGARSEEHTSELQSRPHLVCRLLLEKKNIRTARGAGHVWGSAISPPELGGGAPHMSIVAANALDDYDILACTIPLTGKLLTEDGLWFETARAIAGQILSGQLPRPAVLIGFSFTGSATSYIYTLSLHDALPI